MKQKIITLLALLFGCVATMTAATPSASEIIRQCVARLKASPAVEAAFSVSRGNSASSGNIVISGNKFALSTPELSTWFDGKTQWAYSSAANEVNISEPTPEEIRQINPFAILEAVQTSFTPRRLTSPAGKHLIELTPKGKSEYLKLNVTVNSATNLPESITFTSTDKSTTKINIKSLRPLSKADNGKFRFNPKNYPGAEIVDLR